ncbi:curved DNA-binding protein [Natronocella acetinitrilica]|uniref:Curved DNA-binding protein n=1 Tax=Natronocella acetinitrilica TaxID=414046 RepID=A0AAE3K9U6_9GAMM|nr:DnaJ C-terminal domain-containing protein [Natronocella acetinitrilica]MCP1673160.1 curved DNA-binding protein [Natronocella acetinitrilica]
MEFKDYYKVLGVPRDAPQEVIKKAYRRLARKFHPDVSKESDAEARFKEVSEAYEVLQDPEKRQAYDQLGANWKQGQDFRPPPGWEWQGGGRGAGADAAFSEFFESLFGHGRDPFADFGGFRRASAPRKGQDQTVTTTITLEDAFHGATRNLRLQTRVTDGNGQQRLEPRQLRVRIPAGVTQGQQIRLSGQGQPGVGGGARGDLYLEINIAPHKQYRLEGRDIHLDLPVTPWEAALGCKLQVPTLGGWIDMTVPAGAQNGKRFRLKGRGLPGKPPGDQYVTLQLMTPPADTEKAKALYRRMRDEMPLNPRESLRV